jgi:acyl dehydratase
VTDERGAGAVATTSAAKTAGITDEAVERLRARIGVAEPHPQPPHYTVLTTDVFRHVAEAYGDDNPLWCDPAYGTKTVWGGAIAPPVLVGGDTLVGEDEVTEVAPEQRELMKGDPLRGVHAFYSASAREWWAPLRPGARVRRRNALVGVLDKPSEFAERAVHEWTGQVFRVEDGPLLSAQYRLMIRTERTKARERKKYDDVELAPYTDEQIAEIEAQYASERARGAEPRWWEDVAEGDTVGPMVKGPLTVTDVVCWHVGMGMGLYGVSPLRLGAANRRRIPRFFHRDPQNVPDVMQRVHWDPEFARRSGNPTTFDYGRMRETWLIHLCTDWMGDDAWLWRLDCEFRRFNYVGDTQWLRGTVTRKYEAEGGRPAVDVELVAENQRGEVTTPGHAIILLPSRDRGPVRLPDPTDGATDLQSALDAVAARFADGTAWSAR